MGFLVARKADERGEADWLDVRPIESRGALQCSSPVVNSLAETQRYEQQFRLRYYLCRQANNIPNFSKFVGLFGCETSDGIVPDDGPASGKNQTNQIVEQGFISLIAVLLKTK